MNWCEKEAYLVEISNIYCTIDNKENTMKTLSKKARPEDWIAQFQSLDSWEERYRHIIQMGKSIEPLETRYQTEEYLVKGCQSKVWLVASFDPPKVHFKANSDALIVNGLIAILLEVYSGKAPQDILKLSPTFIEQLGLNTHLSQTRSNGLIAMIKQIKYYALAFSSLSESGKKV